MKVMLALGICAILMIPGGSVFLVTLLLGFGFWKLFCHCLRTVVQIIKE